jgi:hypothetical protein
LRVGGHGVVSLDRSTRHACAIEDADPCAVGAVAGDLSISSMRRREVPLGRHESRVIDQPL